MNLYKSQDDYTDRDWRGHNIAERRRNQQVKERAEAILKNATEVCAFMEEYPEEIAGMLSALGGVNHAEAAFELRQYLQRLAHEQAERETPAVDYENVTDELRGDDGR